MMAVAYLQRFVEEDFIYWTGRIGPWFDPTGPAGNHLLDGRDLQLTMTHGIYVGVAVDGTALYAGKVTRSACGITDRLRTHRQPVEEWSSVWLLPLVVDCPDPLVRCYEAALIRRHRPLWNCQHNRGRQFA
jgi:hypothetical protein